MLKILKDNNTLLVRNLMLILLESTQLIMKELPMLSLLLHRVIYLQEYCSLK
nr:MAG TPA: hypothetical protein [Caudoviricetes sp.]